MLLAVNTKFSAGRLLNFQRRLHRVLSQQVGVLGYKHVVGHTTILADVNGGRASQVQSQVRQHCHGVCIGGFKVNQLPTSPFEGMRQHSGGAGSNSSGAGPFGQRVAHTQSMDTTSNSNHQSADHGANNRALGSSASQMHQEPSPRSRESPFEAYKQQQQHQAQQQQQQVSLCHVDPCVASHVVGNLSAKLLYASLGKPQSWHIACHAVLLTCSHA